MLLLVGLGNPNPNNSNNRHNVGFSVIDAINEKFKLSKQKPKFKGLLTTGKINEQKVFANNLNKKEIKRQLLNMLLWNHRQKIFLFLLLHHLIYTLAQTKDHHQTQHLKF